MVDLSRVNKIFIRSRRNRTSLSIDGVCQVRQLKVRAGVSDVSKHDIEDAANKNRLIITELRDKAKVLQKEHDGMEQELHRF